MDYSETPAGQLAAMTGRQQPAPRPGGRTEAEMRALRREWEQAMDQADAALPGVSPWRQRLAEAREFAEEIRSRGQWISSAGECPQCETTELTGIAVEKLSHECKLNDLRLQESLRSWSRISEAELNGAIRHPGKADIDAQNRARLAAAQAAIARHGVNRPPAA